MRASHTISAIARGSGDAAGAGADAVPDYELLELILFRAAPRRDTKPLAKALLARFGTFAEALNAPEELLREVPGIGEAAITELKLVRAAAVRLMRGEVLERPVLSSWSQVLDYCRASMGLETKEQFRILLSILIFSLPLNQLVVASPTRPPPFVLSRHACLARATRRVSSTELRAYFL
jgi:hypothetical protein